MDDNLEESVNPVTGNTHVLLNGRLFSVGTFPIDEGDGEVKNVQIISDKFQMPVTHANLIEGPDGGVILDTSTSPTAISRPSQIICKVLDLPQRNNSRGLSLSMGDGVGTQLSLGGLTTSGHVTLSNISAAGTLQPVQLLTTTDGIEGDETPQMYVDAEGNATTEVLQVSDGTDLTNPVIISATPVTATPTTMVTSSAYTHVPKKRGGWPKGKRRKAERQSNAPKAPATAYVIYAMERRQEIRKENPDLAFVEVTKLIGSEWSSMGAEQKQKYNELADADKKRYIEELHAYQQTDAYQNYMKRKKLKGLCDEDDCSGEDPLETFNQLDADGLYCKTCNQYFSSLHNRKEHFYGKQHLQNITAEFEKELQQQQQQQQQQEEQHEDELLATRLVSSDLAHEISTSDSDQSALVTYIKQPIDDPPPSDSPPDVTGFIQQFMEKNAEREAELQTLRKSLETSSEEHNAIVQKIEELKEMETKLEQDVGNLKAYGVALATQIGTLRMVPMLFGVINF